ncbi:MAG: YgjV family protein [Clostridia bacterium]|nr:YgjV family protein [Clostridia bacterium]
MTNHEWSLIVSFVAMVLIASSYFHKKKSLYLLFQSIGIVFLMASYLFDGSYFAMIGLVVGLTRVLVYYYYEKRDKTAPLFWPFIFTGLTIVVYLIVNVGILHSVKFEDIVYLTALAFYAFTFRIRDLETMRYMVTIPTALSVLYNVLIGATVFVIISYVFELGANIVSILKYHVFGKDKKSHSEQSR